MSNDKPIIFCGEMVRAILEGRKRQTRRVVKPSSHMIRYCRDRWGCDATNDMAGVAAQINLNQGELVCPYGPVGMRLWVRETYLRTTNKDGTPGRLIYKADGWHTVNGGPAGWRPSIHMPRWASRLTLEVTDIRAQRVQEISHADAWAEGIRCPNPQAGFALLWDSINAERGYGWSVNPWVWAVTFRVAEGGSR